MLSSCVIVGKIIKEPEITKTVNGNSIAYIYVETIRPFKSDDGSVNSDVFKILLWRGIAEECQDHCQIGSCVAIRGRLQSNVYVKDEKTFYNCEIIAEKVAYISN